MVKVRLPLLTLICIAILCATLLWLALHPSTLAQAAPLQAPPDQNTVITSVTHVALGANDIISDPVHHLLYASLPSNVGTEGNHIVRIQTPSGALGASLFVGSEPNHMAVSKDGHYLYVGIDGANAVRRVDLNAYTADIQFALGDSGVCGLNTAEDLVVLQDKPQSVAVAKRNTGCSPGGEEVTIFDNSTARSVSTDSSPHNNSLEPSASPSILYGYNNEDTSFGIHVLKITDSGVAISSAKGGLIDGFAVHILFDNGLLYATSGDVVNPESMTLAGHYDGFGPIAPDSSHSVVYMAASNGEDPIYTLRLFNQSEFTLIKSFPLDFLVGYPKQLVLMDANHLALLTTTGDLYVIALGKYVAQPPHFISAPVRSAKAGIQYTYAISVTDPNYSDDLIVSASTLPIWLNLFGGKEGPAYLQGTPTRDDIGTNPVQLLVTDNKGLTGTQKFNVTVTGDPGDNGDAPDFGSTPPLAVAEGMTYTYIITATTIHQGERLTITAPQAPAWLRLSPLVNGAALLQGMPTKAELGDHAITLRATDPHGLNDTQSFTLTVVAVGQVKGILFDDLNGNGTQEKGEGGIAKAVATLTPVAGTVAAIALQQTAIKTTTAANGAYQFSQVPTGSYHLSFDLPGDRANPPAKAVELTTGAPSVLLTVAVAPKSQELYLPAVKGLENER